MAAVAFSLKDGWKSGAPDYEVGGTMRRDATGFINVGERLREGGGFIVTEDLAEVEALDNFDPLKRVALSEVKPPKKAAAKDEDKGE